MSNIHTEAWLQMFYEVFEEKYGRPPTEKEVAIAAIEAEAKALAKHEDWEDAVAKGEDDL